MKELAEHLARHSVMRFTDVAARDAAFAAANLSPEAGMVAYVGGDLTVYSGTAWAPLAVEDVTPYAMVFKPDDAATDNFMHVIPWTGEVLQGGMVIPAATPTRLVAPRAGIYRMTAQARIQTGAAAANYQLQIRKNAAGANNQGIKISTIWSGLLPAGATAVTLFLPPKDFVMGAGEYVEVFAYGPTDGFVQAFNDQTHANLSYVRAA